MNPEYIGPAYGWIGHHGIGHVSPMNPVGKRGKVERPTASDTPIFDALLAESPADRRAVVALNLAELQDRADAAWAELDAALEVA